MAISLNNSELSGQMLIGVGFIFVNLQQRNILLNSHSLWPVVSIVVGVVAQLPSHVQLFAPYGLRHARPPCPSPSPWVCPSSFPLCQWCPLAISSSDALFSFCPQSFPASGTFPMSWLFTSGDQNTSASASVLPMSIQGWFPLRLTGLIFTLSKGLSGVSSSTTVQRHQFSGALPSLWSSSHNRTWPLGRPLPWLYINIYRWSNVFAFQHSV